MADNVGPGAGGAAGGTTVLGNSIAWGNTGGNLDITAEVRSPCSDPQAEGEGNFVLSPSFVGDVDNPLPATSPCVDTGEHQPWMAEAYDLDGQCRVEIGEDGDGCDIWVDIGEDEAALDAVEMPSADRPFWTWARGLRRELEVATRGGVAGGLGVERHGRIFHGHGADVDGG